MTRARRWYRSIGTKRSSMSIAARGVLAATFSLVAALAGAQTQTASQRGFIEGRGFVFPVSAPNDTTQTIGDLLVREEVFLKPAPWIRFAAGVDLRANSHEQVESEWRLDVSDRSIRRPRAAIRRLTATLTAPHFTLDIGKQFIRWARADVLNPEDRFAPRDYLNVIDTEFLPVLGVRPSFQFGQETFEVVWVPRFTPSRLPLINQRWTVVPEEAAGLTIVDGGATLPKGSQQGVRWSHVGSRFETSLSFFDGFNHLPNIDVQLLPVGVEVSRVYPSLRSYGADLAVPTKLVTLKGEANYFTSPDSRSDEYVLYVVEVERQVGEWVMVIGYAGEAVTQSSGAVSLVPGRAAASFAPDRGIARSILGRVSYTVDPQRTVAVEGAARQNGDGVYVKGEYSQGFGQHWRLTLTGVGIGGNVDDFLGQYNRNSHGSLAMRFSF